VPLQRLCELAGLSRASFYRWRRSEPEPDPDLDLRDAIQRIALEWPAYGRRRVKAELKRIGWIVNHKRICRILREDNRLCLRRRKFRVLTTDSKHGRPV
jgi:transposase InsO family protein